MTRKEMKATLIKAMGIEKFNRRYEQLKDAYGATAALITMMRQEIDKPTVNADEYMTHVFYEIG